MFGQNYMMEQFSYLQEKEDQLNKAVISIFCFCLGSAVLLWSRPTNKQAAGTNNCCNNPSCLRCHSTSQQHAQLFQNNVMMLRRLVQLEPELFHDMRSGIWDEVKIIEERFESECNNSSFSLFLARIEGLFKGARLLFTQNHFIDASNEQQIIPLSPQQGQNPTVFFLNHLEAIPLHHIEHYTKTQCPCIRLWKQLPKSPNEPPIKLTGDIEALVNYFSIIRDELTSAIQANSSAFQPFDNAVYEEANYKVEEHQKHQSKRAEWSSIYLYQQGIKQVHTCKEYFPITTNILETMCPHRMSGCGFGSVYFSKLKQNTKVVEHCGPTNVRLRFHLPLVVPDNTSGSYLKVGDQCISWEEGKPILFDDSFLHSAVWQGANDSEHVDSSESHRGYRDRIVLIVDFWHPSLSEADRTALGVLYPPGS